MAALIVAAGRRETVEIEVVRGECQHCGEGIYKEPGRYDYRHVITGLRVCRGGQHYATAKKSPATEVDREAFLQS